MLGRPEQHSESDAVLARCRTGAPLAATLT